MNFFTSMKQYLYAFVALVIVTLSGALFYQKKRADRNAEEIDDLENEIQANDITNEVKNFQAVNKERKKGTDEKIETTPTPSNIEPNTTYRL